MHVRSAAVAGQFYPSNPETLRADVERYLDDAKTDAVPEKVPVIVAPHAGYVYSGPTAGYAFARVRGKKPKRAILLGRSHRYYFTGASVYTSGAFETPLGLVPIDEAFAEALARETESDSTAPHEQEHALEVELPFLQVALGDIPIVPVLFGSEATGWHLELGRTLARMAEASDLLIASTDLSHFMTEPAAQEIDHVSLDRILSKDYRALTRDLADEKCSMCGGTAVTVAMVYALEKHAEDWRLLHYSTSAAASGDYNRVVGYGALSMEYTA